MNNIGLHSNQNSINIAINQNPSFFRRLGIDVLDSKNIKIFQKEFFEIVKKEQDIYLNFIYELLFPNKNKEISNPQFNFNILFEQIKKFQINPPRSATALFSKNMKTSS